MFIRSERLFLRPCWPEDRAALEALGGAGPAGDAIAAVLGSDGPEVRRSARFLVTVPGSGIIGAASLLRADDAAELRLWIAPAWRNFGYATEAVEALAEVACMLGHDYLRALVYHGNRSALGVLDRTAFTATRGAMGQRPSMDVREFPSTWFHRALSGPDGRDGDGDGTGGGADTLAA